MENNLAEQSSSSKSKPILGKKRKGVADVDLEKQQTRLERLRQKLAAVPQLPGVYIHKAPDGKILYVGKAKNLQSRLRSYFTGLERHSPKTRALVAKIEDFDIIVVDNENESLLLENNLIKHNKPPYNILLRDDKTYPYLKINLQEPWPRLLKTRRRKNDGALYFGPYTNGGQLHNLLSVINRFFPLVKCPPSIFNTVERPCNYYSIKQCLGPCKLAVERRDYLKIAEAVVAILRGRTLDVVRELKKEMADSAAKLMYEKAAGLRDQVRALEGLGEQQSVTFAPGMDVDVIGSYWHSDLACFHVAIVRDGKLVSGENIVLKIGIDDVEGAESACEKENANRERVIVTFLCQYYSRREIPPAVCIPCADKIVPAQRFDAVKWFLNDTSASRVSQGLESVSLKAVYENADKAIKELLGVKCHKELKESFYSLCNLCDENARNRFQEDLQMDEKSRTMVVGLQTFLQLEKLPVWIECFDISTFQGAETVASQVVFKDGKPSKSDYRKYIVKDVVGQDDFASLREVMRRRFKEERRTEIPDLLLIDGGEPQVREVGRMLKSLGLDPVAFVGIAKSRTARDFTSSAVSASSERLVVPIRDESGELLPDKEPRTFLLRPGSAEFRLVTQLRDEAHRFAITFHRKRRDKSSTRSILTSIKGLGPKRRKKLLETFASVADIAAASAAEIAKAAGISLALGQEIKEILSRPSRA
jgi:excinuclease ABC subunit C